MSMDSIDSLPDRKLTHEEFRQLQADFESKFDAPVYTTETSYLDVAVIIIEMDESERILHYTDESGWHECDGSIEEH
jgi:hypothetical protein